MNNNETVKENLQKLHLLNRLIDLLTPFGKNGLPLETEDEKYINQVEIAPQVYKTIEYIRSDGDALSIEVRLEGETEWKQLVANRFNVDLYSLIDDVEDTIEIMNL